MSWEIRRLKPLRICMLASPLVERGECGEAGLCMAGQWHLGAEVSQPGNSGTFGVD